MPEFSTFPPKITYISWNALLDHGLEKGVSYIVRKNGSTYEAINGSTGRVDYSSAVPVTVVNSAISALASGGLVKITKGGYALTSSVLIDNAGIEIQMEDGATFTASSAITMVKITKDYCRLYAPRLRSTSSGCIGVEVVGANHCKIYNPYIYLTKGTNSSGIKATDVNNLEVSGGYVRTASYGIGIHKGTLDVAYDNQIHNVMVEDISILGIHAQYQERFRLSDYQVKDVADNGVDILNSTDFTVSGGHLYNAGNPNGYAIGLYQESGGTCRFGSVLGNVIKSSYAVAIVDATDIKVSNNFSESSLTSGFDLLNSSTRVELSGNTVVSPAGNGIYLGSSTSHCQVIENILRSIGGTALSDSGVGTFREGNEVS